MAKAQGVHKVSYTSRTYTWLQKPGISLEELEIARARLMNRQCDADESTRKDIWQALIAIEARRNHILKEASATDKAQYLRGNHER